MSLAVAVLVVVAHLQCLKWTIKLLNELQIASLVCLSSSSPRPPLRLHLLIDAKAEFL